NPRERPGPRRGGGGNVSSLGLARAGMREASPRLARARDSSQNRNRSPSGFLLTGLCCTRSHPSNPFDPSAAPCTCSCAPSPLARRCGRWREALDMLNQVLLEDNITADTVSYSAAISACEKGRSWPWALVCLGDMRRRGVGRDVIVFGAAMSACEKGSQWHLALSLLDQMRLERVDSNVVACSAAVSACEKAQEWSRALELFEERLLSGSKLDVIFCSAGISACEKGCLGLHLC
ncbi:unnamed protein product, partial [Prorocentrum cordatum]